MDCLVCNNELKNNGIENYDDYSLEKFAILECNECGIGSTKIGDNFDIGRYYPDVYYGNHAKRFNFISEFAVKVFRINRVFRILKFSSKNNNKILDIGCGRGVELQILKKLGWDCTGTEYSKYAEKILKDKDISFSNSLEISKCKFKKNSFDFVTLWHVLEHLINPKTELEAIANVLKKGGKLIIEVPQFRSWQHLISTNKWIYLETPRHTHHFTKDGLIKLMPKELKIKKIKTFSLEYGLIGFITNVMNLIIPEKNFLFKILFREKRHRMSISGLKMFFYNILAFLLFLPLLALSFIFEMISSFIGKGSIVRIYAEKQ